jgi:hypothetical protein
MVTRRHTSILDERSGPGEASRPVEPEAVVAHLHLTLPDVRTNRRDAMTRMMVIVVALIGFMLPIPGIMKLVLGISIACLLVGWSYWQRHERRMVGETLMRTEELTTVGRYHEAWDAGWDGLALCRRSAAAGDAWLRMLLAMGRAALMNGRYETVEAISAFLADRIAPDDPLMLYCRMQRSIAAALDGRPGVAEEELTHVRGLARNSANPTARATTLLAELAQCRAANQPERALDHLHDLASRLAPLGRDAGIGHALAAWALARLGRVDEARRSWLDARLLLDHDILRRLIDPRLEASLRGQADA